MWLVDLVPSRQSRLLRLYMDYLRLAMDMRTGMVRRAGDEVDVELLGELGEGAGDAEGLLSLCRMGSDFWTCQVAASRKRGGIEASNKSITLYNQDS